MYKFLCLYTNGWIVLLFLQLQHKIYASPSNQPFETRLEPRGTITNEFYPHYDMETHEEWGILGHLNDTITISFEDINIYGDCNTTYIYIGPNPERRYCELQDSHHKTYISHGPYIHVKFVVANPSRAGRGFKFSYITGPKYYPEQCLDDLFRCDSGKCIYQTWRCNGAYECTDHSDENNCEQGTRTCSSDEFGCQSILHEYICLSSDLLCDGLQHCLDGLDELHQSCVQDSSPQCGVALGGPAGYFTSPGYPIGFKDKRYCFWVIHVSVGGVIQLRVQEFFPMVSTGEDNYVEIFDGPSNSSSVLGHYTSSNTPPSLIESSSNKMMITLHTDGSLLEKGFNFTYQLKGYCLLDQNACSYNEHDCYETSQKCDGEWNCPIHGGDERGCGHCGTMQFKCGPKGTQCFNEEVRCNGVDDCSDNRDEMGCTSTQCGSHNGTFLCDNTLCIYESWWCDGTNDCGDNSDEINCFRPSLKVIAAAVIGSLICGLLLVIAVGCTCKLYAIRFNYNQAGSSSHSSPITDVQRAIRARRMAPPPYDEAMLTSRPFDEVAAEVRSQLQAAAEAEQTNSQHIATSDEDVPMLHAGDMNSCVDPNVDMSADDMGVDTRDDRLLDISQGNGSDSQFELAEYETVGRSRLSRWGISVKQFLGIAPRQSTNHGSRSDSYNNQNI